VLPDKELSEIISNAKPSISSNIVEVVPFAKVTVLPVTLEM
jgi:hypothetical protein